MATYSKYIGLPWESSSTTLIVATDSGTYSFAFTDNSILESMKDNEDAYVTPKYLRDMFLSTWDTIAFKETSASGSSISYIGIDSGQADDYLTKPSRDIEGNKILIGKRSFSGTHSYTASNDVMASSLIDSEIDLYFYNTRPDTASQNSTRIIMLAGTEAIKHSSAPYLQAQVFRSPGGTQSLSLDIVNASPLGNIYIQSRGQLLGYDLNVGGTVSVNGIVFPTIATSSASPGGLDSKNLILRNGELSWEKIEFPETDHIGITGSALNISGSPVNLNGVSLEFTDDRKVSAPIGDIALGSTFNRMSIADVIRKLVYPYLPPICSLELVTPIFLEVGTYPSIVLKYTITKRTNSTKPTKLINMIPSTYPAISSPGQTFISGTARGVVPTPLAATSSIFTAKASDGANSNIATASIFGIYPYFYGFTSSNTLNISALGSLNKSVEGKGDKSYDLTGYGNLFFAYDYDYGPLAQILDPNNTNIIASFSSTVKTLSSPTGLWASKQYRVYQLSGVPQIGPPSENFEFKY